MKSFSVPGKRRIQQFCVVPGLLRALRLPFFILYLLFSSISSFAQVNADDLADAEALSKKYEDEPVVCRSSYHYFTFDKGKNSLDDKVVVVQEEAEMEFISTKR